MRSACEFAIPACPEFIILTRGEDTASADKATMLPLRLLLKHSRPCTAAFTTASNVAADNAPDAQRCGETATQIQFGNVDARAQTKRKGEQDLKEIKRVTIEKLTCENRDTYR